MKTIKFRFGLLALAIFSFISCSNEPNPEQGIYGPGIYVTNEGNFGQSNGSISYIPRNTYNVYNNIFANANDNAILGDVVQSINMHNNKAYIVVNNSNKVVVVNAENFKISATITDRELPRYIAFLNNKAYLSEWVNFTGNGKISVIDLSSNTVTKSITVGKLPEKLLIHNNRLYVTNSSDSLVHIINLSSETVESTLTVGDWPNSIVLDKNNKIWILCGGKPSWAGTPTYGKLIRYNPSNQQIELTLNFPNDSSNPSNLCINNAGDELYYLYANSIYKMNINQTSLPSNSFVTTYAYGVGLDPSTGYLFIADPVNFTGNGVVRWYNSSGSLVDTAVVGIIPNGFYFWEP